MLKWFSWIPLALAALPGAAADLLIVADEIPAMEYLAKRMEDHGAGSSKIVTQSQLPADLAPFRAVIVYIHRDLQPAAEKAMIQYTTQGGRLIALHHSISSGKRKNKDWFSFLGVSLPAGQVDAGGYKWIEPVSLDVVNLAPTHFITTNRVEYLAKVSFQSAPQNEPKTLPGFHLDESEVYLNHVLTDSRTVLLGLRYQDAPSGKVYCQSHAGWVKPSGQGWIVYLLPGHSQRDFEVPAYARIIANAVLWKP